MSKYFLVNPSVEFSSKETVNKLHKDKVDYNNQAWVSRETLAEEALKKECPLKHVDGRVIVKVDMEMKNRTTLSGGLVIRRERKFNNFNFREVNPSNAIVVSAENIPTGAEILIDYTSIHDSYRIFNYNSGSSDVHFYSIKEEECYAWRVGNDKWQPTKNCEFGLRVFKPYEGKIQGIEPKVIKDVLYCTTGDLKGKVVNTLKGCDYTIIFHNEHGKEENIIRFRHSEDDLDYALEEVVWVNTELTEKVDNGELLIGIETKNAHPLNVSYA